LRRSRKAAGQKLQRHLGRRHFHTERFPEPAAFEHTDRSDVNGSPVPPRLVKRLHSFDVSSIAGNFFVLVGSQARDSRTVAGGGQ